jgi:hypothetical protein
MVMIPAEPRTKNDFASEGQQQLTRLGSGKYWGTSPGWKRTPPKVMYNRKVHVPYQWNLNGMGVCQISEQVLLRPAECRNVSRLIFCIELLKSISHDIRSSRTNHRQPAFLEVQDTLSLGYLILKITRFSCTGCHLNICIALLQSRIALQHSSVHQEMGGWCDRLHLLGNLNHRCYYATGPWSIPKKVNLGKDNNSQHSV